MWRHLALFTALALASANEGELRLSLTYNDMADDDDSTTLSAHFDEPLSRVQVYHAGEWLDVCDSDSRESWSDYLDRREQAADTRRREVVATRLALANELEALSANMTLMEEERKHALQAAAQRADAIKLEEAQYAQLEGDGAAERSSLWGLDERLRQLRATTPNALAAAAAAVAIYNP